MLDIDIIRDAFDIYSRHYVSLGDYSATTIIDSPRRVALHKRYGESITHTPESQAASLIGTAVHDKMESLLRQANVLHPQYWIERSVVSPVTIDFPDGPRMRLLAGKFDILKHLAHLTDIKTCKTWKIIFDPEKIEWTKQLNIYAWLLNQRGVFVETLRVVAFFLDWIEGNAIKDKTYPNGPIMEYDISLWDIEEQERFIKQRLKLHIEAEDMKDDDLPKCTQDEMWEKPPEFGIMKDQNAKRAMKVVRDGDLHSAIEIAQTLPMVSQDSFIEVRYTKRKRCEKYCAINEYCNQYKQYVDNGGLTKRTEIFHLGGII
jgi:hypothetical protein